MHRWQTWTIRALNVTATLEPSTIPREVVPANGPAGDVLWLVEIQGGSAVLPARLNGKNYRRLLRDLDAAKEPLAVVLQASLRTGPGTDRLGLMDAGFRAAPKASVPSAVGPLKPSEGAPGPLAAAALAVADAGTAAIRLRSIEASIAVAPSALGSEVLGGDSGLKIGFEGHPGSVEVRFAGGRPASEADGKDPLVLRGELKGDAATGLLVLENARLEAVVSPQAPPRPAEAPAPAPAQVASPAPTAPASAPAPSVAPVEPPSQPPRNALPEPDSGEERTAQTPAPSAPPEPPSVNSAPAAMAAELPPGRPPVEEREPTEVEPPQPRPAPGARAAASRGAKPAPNRVAPPGLPAARALGRDFTSAVRQVVVEEVQRAVPPLFAELERWMGYLSMEAARSGAPPTRRRARGDRGRR